MQTTIIAINSKYIHPATAAFQLQRNAFSDVKVLEFTIKDDISVIINEIKHSVCDLLGFSVYIWNVEIVKQILVSLHADSYKTPIVLGGPEVSYDASTYLHHFHASYVIENEGEDSFNELVEHLMGLRQLHHVSNLHYMKDNRSTFTFRHFPNLENIKHDFRYVLSDINRIVYVEASRGCYFRCTYCQASLEERVRFFPIEQTKNELLYLLQENVPTIKFLDRSFNVRSKHMLDILTFLHQHDNHHTTIQFEIVGDLLTDEVVEFLKGTRPGYFRLEIGIQSLFPKTLKAIRRNQNFDRLKYIIETLRDYIIIHADLIAGLPYETLHEFKHTFNQSYLLFAQELQLGFLKELKGTEISLTKDKHRYQFSTTAPYEVIQNAYMSHDDFLDIKLVEAALNRYHNKGYFPKTNMYLFFNQHLNPYETFKTVSLYVQNNHQQFTSMQLSDFAKTYFESLKSLVSSQEEFLYTLKKDYLSRSKIRPKIWWERTIDKPTRRTIYQTINYKKQDITMDMLYKHGHIELFQNTCFLVLYLPNNTLYEEFVLTSY